MSSRHNKVNFEVTENLQKINRNEKIPKMSTIFLL